MSRKKIGLILSTTNSGIVEGDERCPISKWTALLETQEKGWRYFTSEDMMRENKIFIILNNKKMTAKVKTSYDEEDYIEKAFICWYEDDSFRAIVLQRKKNSDKFDVLSFDSAWSTEENRKFAEAIFSTFCEIVDDNLIKNVQKPIYISLFESERKGEAINEK